MNDETKFNQSIRESLNSHLIDIDPDVQKKLAEIRRSALSRADEMSRESQSSVVVLSRHSIWKNKKLVGLGLAMAASFMLVAISPSVIHSTQSIDYSSDMLVYSEVDPDWVTDMDIAYALGDE